MLDSSTLQFSLSQLPQQELSTRLSNGLILIDSTAADLGWHSGVSTNIASDKIDLVSVLVHELAISLGLNPATAITDGTPDAGELSRSVNAQVDQDLPDSFDQALVTASLPAGALTAENDAVTAVIDEAVRLWNTVSISVAGNSTATATIVRPDVTFGELGQGELARTLADGSILLDSAAAGHGWFVGVDDTGLATSSRIDLLSVIVHEMGHGIGLDHDHIADSIDVMDETLAPNVRNASVPDDAISVVTVDSSDQTKLVDGLEALGDWVGDLGLRIDDFLNASVALPLVGDISLDSVFSLGGDAASTLASAFQTEIVDNVASVFTGLSVTNLDIANRDNLEFAPGLDAISYRATVALPGFDSQYDLDPSALNFAGIDPSTLGMSITSDQAPSLNISGDLALSFVFGLDSQGEFYVDSPSVSANLDLHSGKDDSGELIPFDVEVGLGPVGLGINQGHIDISASMGLGIDQRLDYSSLINNASDPANLLPTLEGEAYWDIDLPLELTGGFSGLNGEGLTITSSGSIDSGMGSIASVLDAIEFDTGSLNELLELRAVSLDMVLDGLQSLLDEMIGVDLDVQGVVVGGSLEVYEERWGSVDTLDGGFTAASDQTPKNVLLAGGGAASITQWTVGGATVWGYEQDSQLITLEQRWKNTNSFNAGDFAAIAGQQGYSAITLQDGSSSNINLSAFHVDTGAMNADIPFTGLSIADVLGDGPSTNFVVGLRDAINDIRYSANNINQFQDQLNEYLNNTFQLVADNSDPISLTYLDSIFKLDFDLGFATAADYPISLDVNDLPIDDWMDLDPLSL